MLALSGKASVTEHYDKRTTKQFLGEGEDDCQNRTWILQLTCIKINRNVRKGHLKRGCAENALFKGFLTIKSTVMLDLYFLKPLRESKLFWFEKWEFEISGVILQ